jgi:hypothetical protein
VSHPDSDVVLADLFVLEKPWLKAGGQRLWWCPGGSGYTPHLAEAGVFAEPEARRRSQAERVEPQEVFLDAHLVLANAGIFDPTEAQLAEAEVRRPGVHPAQVPDQVSAWRVRLPRALAFVRANPDRTVDFARVGPDARSGTVAEALGLDVHAQVEARLRVGPANAAWREARLGLKRALRPELARQTQRADLADALTRGLSPAVLVGALQDWAEGRLEEGGGPRSVELFRLLARVAAELELDELVGEWPDRDSEEEA